MMENTKDCAFDAFGSEFHVGDKVVVAVSRWTGDYILCKGEVTGWSTCRVKIKIIDGAINSVKPANDTRLPWNSKLYNKETSRLMDKIIKLS